MQDCIIDNFILEHSNFLPKEYCESLIEYYENMNAAGFTSNRYDLQGTDSHRISDTNFAFQSSGIIKLHATTDYSSEFLNMFWSKIYPLYTQKYSIIKDSDPHKIFALKMQKTEVGEGYHIWHNECSSIETSGRFLTFIAYLNDVEEGGETEFLYYPKRVKAEQGKIVLFPGSFSHTHRGNSNISNEKYILTGWVEY